MLVSPQASATKNTSWPRRSPSITLNAAQAPVQRPAMTRRLRPVASTAFTNLGVSQALMDVRSTTSGPGNTPSVTSGTNGPAKASAVTVDRTVGTLNSFALLAMI